MSSVSMSVDQRMSDDELLKNYQLSLQEFLPSPIVPGALKAMIENRATSQDQKSGSEEKEEALYRIRENSFGHSQSQESGSEKREEAAIEDDANNNDEFSDHSNFDPGALVAELQKSMSNFMKDLEVAEEKGENIEIALTKSERFAMIPKGPSYISKGVVPTAPVRRDDDESRKKTGSEMHGTGDCSACGFFYKGKCSDGFDCKYCHLCTKADMRDKRDKARKKLKETRRLQE